MLEQKEVANVYILSSNNLELVAWRASFQTCKCVCIGGSMLFVNIVILFSEIQYHPCESNIVRGIACKGRNTICIKQSFIKFSGNIFLHFCLVFALVLQICYKICTICEAWRQPHKGKSRKILSTLNRALISISRQCRAVWIVEVNDNFHDITA